MPNIDFAGVPIYVRETYARIKMARYERWHQHADNLATFLLHGESKRVLELHALLTFLMEENFSGAVSRGSEERRTSPINFETSLMRCLNSGYPFTQEDVEIFYQKGIIKGAEQFFRAKKDLAPGALFDQWRQKILPEHKAVISSATDFALKGNRAGSPVNISASSLMYVLALLLPEEKERKKALNLLEEKNRDHLTHLKNAKHAIGYFCQLLNIEVEGSVLEKAPENKENQDTTAVTEDVKLSFKRATITKLEEIEQSAKDRRIELLEKLKGFVATGEIKQEVALLYFQREQGVYRAYSKEQQKMFTKISGLLVAGEKAAAATIQSALDELHQPTPVGP